MSHSCHYLETFVTSSSLAWPVSSQSFKLSYLGRGGRPSDFGSRGPEFDSHWELSSFLFSTYISISGASLIRSLVEVQHYWFFNFPTKKWRLSCAAWGEASFNLLGMSKKVKLSYLSKASDIEIWIQISAPNLLMNNHFKTFSQAAECCPCRRTAHSREVPATWARWAAAPTARRPQCPEEPASTGKTSRKFFSKSFLWMASGHAIGSKAALLHGTAVAL